jgi:regulator of protease activity HflC (stomatin/prohibitin superfamily)
MNPSSYSFIISVAAGSFFAIAIIPMLFAIGSALQFWRVIPERTVQVYTLFGKVIGRLDQPGINLPIARFGPRALLIPMFGKVYPVRTQIYQHYLRDQLVNSEEGAPMGVGIWYEKMVTSPEDYLFRNSDPSGSLAANVATAVIKQLSNLKLEVLLEDRNALSRKVREEVSPTSRNWGYSLGSTYIRKVAFRDQGMIKEIEKKVVNRLRQVTAGMRQAGDNTVAIIKSDADKRAAEKMGKAQAVRPRIVGEALAKIRGNLEVADALFRLLDIQATLKSPGKIVLLPKGTDDVKLLLSS